MQKKNISVSIINCVMLYKYEFDVTRSVLSMRLLYPLTCYFFSEPIPHTKNFTIYDRASQEISATISKNNVHIRTTSIEILEIIDKDNPEFP